MIHWRMLLLAAGCVVLPGAAASQGAPPPKTRPDTTRPPIPREALPPKGMCRIWMDGVPLARQPAPTDCATAIRNRPPNARVIFPDDSSVARPRRPDTTKTRPRRDTVPARPVPPA